MILLCFKIVVSRVMVNAKAANQKGSFNLKEKYFDQSKMDSFFLIKNDPGVNKIAMSAKLSRVVLRDEGVVRCLTSALMLVI